MSLELLMVPKRNAVSKKSKKISKGNKKVRE